ncbi:MAG: hypothetical protein ACRD9S_22335 [Pyrinomonadaceae bacterium]
MKLISNAIILLTLIIGVANVTTAQEKQKPMPTPSPAARPMTADPPAANPADVASVDSIIAAVYDVISGPAGKKRDWDRMRSLFLPGARLIPTGARPGGAYGSRVLTVDEYIERSSGFFDKEGFYEKEVARVAEQFGQIVHAFSTYESRHAPDEPKAFQRGINSIQLMNDGKRWWIVTIFWQGEDEKTPLPEKYLKTR